MFKFKVKQKVFDIGGTKVGGLPGERPTVLIGTIFYHGQRIITDEAKGDFDEEKAFEVIKKQEEFSEKTGNPCALDVVGSTPAAIEKFLTFVTEVTDSPILIDGVSADAKIAGLEFADKSGLEKAFIYNSITPESTKIELEKIREVGIESAVLLAYTPTNFTSKGRVEAMKSLLSTASEIGIDKPLIDTCVIDIPSLGMACKAIFELKNIFGLPAGCGSHNAVSTWMGLKRKMGKQAFDPCMSVSNAIAVAAGADFVLYGPIEHANYIFPAIAMVDAAYAQLAIEQHKMPNRSHPIYRIA